MHDTLKNLLATTRVLEKQATAVSRDNAEITKELLEINEALDGLAKKIKADEANSGYLRLIAVCRDCNSKRVQVLMGRDLSSDEHATSEKALNAALKSLMQERLTLVQDIFAEELDLQAELMEQMTAYMHPEDAALINVLLAVSYADGRVHRKESKLIQKRFKKITLRMPDKEVLEAGIATIDAEFDTILKQLRKDAKTMTSEVRNEMFFASIAVAVADSELHSSETKILLQAAEALGVLDEDGKPLKEEQTLLDIVERRKTLS